MKTRTPLCHYPLRLLLVYLLVTGPVSAGAEEAPVEAENAEVENTEAESSGPPATAAPETPPPQKNILTLDQCLKRALARSKQIEAEKHRLDILSEQQDQLWWLPFSDLQLEGGVGFLPDKCADITGGRIQGCNGDDVQSDYDFKGQTWGPSFHIKFGGNIPLPTSNRFFKAKEALEEAYKAKEAMLPTIKHRIAFDVHRAFHGVVGAREMLYTIAQGRKHLSKARAKVEENLEKQVGDDTQIDLLKLKVFESRLDAMEQQVIQIEKTALAALNFLVGAEADAPIDIPNDPQDIVQRDLLDLDTYKKTAVEKRPEFDALRHGIKALKAKITTTKGAFIPEAAFFFNFRAGYTPGVEVREQKVDDNDNPETDANGDPVYDNDASTPFLWRNSYNYGSIIPSFGLVVRVPLDIGVNVHKLRESKAELKALLADKTYAMEGVMLEVETTYVEVTSLLETITALNKSKKLAKGWINAAAQNHAIGLGSTKELKDALKEYFTIMGELHQRIGEYNIAIAKLDKVTGVILK